MFSNHYATSTNAKMSRTLFLLLISIINANPLPNLVQINQFDVFQQQTERNQIELYKKVLIKNFIVTSDNLKLLLNMERSGNVITESKEKPRSLYMSNNDFTDSEETLTEDQNWRMDQDMQPMDSSFQKMKGKRQIDGLEGAGGDTQVVMGTFQAMMRPMSTRYIPGLGQNSVTQNGEVKEMENTKK